MDGILQSNLSAPEAPIVTESRRSSIYEGVKLKPTSRVESFYRLLRHLHETRTTRFPVAGLIIATRLASESRFYWESDLLTHFPDEKIRRNLFSLEATGRIVTHETAFEDVAVQSLTFST